MDTASPFIYAYTNSASEDSDEDEVVLEKGKQIKRKKRARVSDTNVLKINFICLQEANFVTSVKPIRCIKCPAILTSSETLLNNLDGAGRKWQCSYCGSKNTLSAERDVNQLTEDTTYLSEQDLEEQSTKFVKTNQDIDEEDDSIIHFCIDISGSMEETIITRKEQQTTVYISRLDATKAAITSQLKDLAKYKPRVKVGITTFSSEVVYNGDGHSSLEYTAKGKILENKNELLKIGRSLNPPHEIKTSLSKLLEIVKRCKPLSLTALGPALLICTAATSKCRGSKVILCTDGMANVGLGNLEAYSSAKNIKKAEEFYSYVSTYAKELGSSISILAISGGECRLAELGNVAVNTNGQVNIVDPVNLGEEFKGILKENIVGTNVEATVILPQGFYIRDYMAIDNKSMFYKTFEIGTATASTEFTLEYGLNLEKHRNLNKESIRFQLIIKFKNKKGSSIIRVIEKVMKITHDRKVAEEKINMEVLAVNALQQGGRMHGEGNIIASKSRMRAAKRYFGKNMADDDLFSETDARITNYLDDLHGENASASKAELKLKRTDIKSKNLFTNMGFSSKMFNKKK